MSTVTLKTGEIIPKAVFEDIYNKLKTLEHERPNEFFRLVKSCRHPNYEVKRCIWPAKKCRSHNHTGCWDLKPYSKLIISIDENAHATIDPTVRAIVLAATPALLMPRLISPQQFLYVTLRNGHSVPEAAVEPVMDKLRKLEKSRTDIQAFHELIRLSRNPDWKISSCLYRDMLVTHKLLDEKTGQVDPVTRSIVHAATLTKRSYLPVVIWPVLEESSINA